MCCSGPSLRLPSLLLFALSLVLTPLLLLQVFPVLLSLVTDAAQQKDDEGDTATTDPSAGTSADTREEAPPRKPRFKAGFFEHPTPGGPDGGGPEGAPAAAGRLPGAAAAATADPPAPP